MSLRTLLAGAGLALGISACADAALLNTGLIGGNDCGAGGFSSCYATLTGTGNGLVLPAGAGWTTIRFAPDDGQFQVSAVSTRFPTLSGSEFVLALQGNVLSWRYAPGAGDPPVTYFSVKQANGFVLFYNSDFSPLTQASVNLSSYFGQPGLSHVTFFDALPAPAVPEPISATLLGAGLVGLGLVRRRRGPDTGRGITFRR